jgi:hypothetical protein
MAKVGKLLTEWDTAKVIESQVELLRENGEYQDKKDEELFNLVSQDSDLFTLEWESLCKDLTILMNKKNKHSGWKATVNNFGWQKLDGHKEFQAKNGKEFLQKILPETECSFKIYNYGRGFAINNAHHDSPSWDEWYYITPSAKLMA